MNKKEKDAMDSGSPRAADLRQEAERRLCSKQGALPEGMAAVDVRALVHELQVHQIELEMQNEELLRSQVALHEVSDKYHDLFDFAPIGYFRLDGQGRILEVNLAGAALLGRNRNAVTLKRFAQFVAVENRPAFADFCHRVLATDTRETCEVKLLRDGQPVHALVEGVAAQDHQRQEKLFCAAVIDITERKQAEEQLAELDRRKDQFLAMLSHELRNPLAPILNAVQLLQLQKSENPVQQEALTILERQVRQLTHLVGDLLDVSRATAGCIRLCHERVNLRSIVERAVETAGPLIDQRRHTLTVSLPPDAIWLYVDASRLEQVMTNLLTNAAKYTHEGGRIRLSAQQEGDKAVLRVRDTGLGIGPDFLPRIFDPFAQAKRSSDRSQGGLGIGLTLAKRLVEMHEGAIEVSSTLGRGSEFVVRLPICPPGFKPLETQPPPTKNAAKPIGTALRVLVVDDNVPAAKVLEMLVLHSGHLARMAHTGPAALAAAVDYRPDVVLLDIGLPELDGFEVAKRIRQDPLLQDTVLVAITGYGHEADRQHSQEAGFDHHLVKPADFEKVRQILAESSEKATAEQHLPSKKTASVEGMADSLARGPAPVAQLAAATPSPVQVSPPATAVVFNPEEAIRRCFNDKDMVRKMIQSFCKEVDVLFLEMRAALEKGDLREVGQLGHRMKGTVLYLGADLATQAARRVERFYTASSFIELHPSEPEEAINALEHECMMLKSALSKHPLAQSAN